MNRYYKPGSIPPYEQTTSIYQQAFAGYPWFEVSKCADQCEPKRCIANLSALAVGQICEICSNKTTEPAYKPSELTSKFKAIADSRPTAWYTEESKDELTMAALSWKATPEVVAAERYADVPLMQAWLKEQFAEEGFTWLDEIFADLSKKPDGNLENFKSICCGFAEQFGKDKVAFRSINERLIGKASKIFGDDCTIYARNKDIPDRRDFVVINFKEQA
jgi:hypothetical protein